MKPFFSVLVPVYNQVGLMDECIRCLSEQTYSDFEVIIVDDGSTDDSLKILKEFAEKDKRVKVIEHGVNKSLLAARFTAMDKAEGEYTFFLDSDDYIENDGLEKLHTYLTENDVEAVRFGYVIEPQGEKVLPQPCENTLTAILKTEIPPAIWKNCFQTAVVKRAIADAESFYCNMGEDSFMAALLFSHCDKVGVLNEYIYHYNIGIGMSAQKKSVSTDKVKKGMESVVASGEHILEVIGKVKPDYLSDARQAVLMMKVFVASQSLLGETDIANYVRLLGAVDEVGQHAIFEALCNNHLVSKVFELRGVKNPAPDVSVIIPMYNAKEYILYTIESVLGQTKKEIEVLVIDDCSTDGCFEMCQKQYANDPRVRVIRQKQNGGPGKARNSGIALARGKYVAFLDADDQYVPDYLRELYECAEQYGADVVHSTGCFMAVSENMPDNLLEVPADHIAHITLDHMDEKLQDIMVVDEDPQKRFEAWTAHHIHWAVWNKLYNREFLLQNKIEFGMMRMAEDHHFVFSCLFSGAKYVMIPNSGYVYRIVDSSVSRGKKDINFLIKLLVAEFECDLEMKKITSRIPFFAEDKARSRKAIQYAEDGIEFGYLRAAYWAVGAENVRASEEIYQLFEERFGDRAAYVFEMFNDAHEFRTPGDEVQMEKYNSASFLRKLLEDKHLPSMKDYQEAQMKKMMQ